MAWVFHELLLLLLLLVFLGEEFLCLTRLTWKLAFVECV